MAGLLSAQLRNAQAAGAISQGAGQQFDRIQQRDDMKDTAEAQRKKANIQAGFSIVGAAVGLMVPGGSIAGAALGSSIGNAVGSMINPK